MSSGAPACAAADQVACMAAPRKRLKLGDAPAGSASAGSSLNALSQWADEVRVLAGLGLSRFVHSARLKVVHRVT